MKIAVYYFSKWIPLDAYNPLNNLLCVPFECELVPYQDANLIVVVYGSNADHIPFLSHLLETYTKKNFLFIIGEYLRRTQAIIPKKISTKASHAQWARRLFPYVYLPSHICFPFPTRHEDKKLYALLYHYRNNARIYSVLCEDAPELGKYSCHFPIFMRNFISHFVKTTSLIHMGDAHERYQSAVEATRNHRPNTSSSKSFDFVSIFGNTTKERIQSINICKRFGKVWIYGHNPYSLGRPKDKRVIYNDTTFVLCFENTRAPGYVTEKLMDVIISQSIPIYWGDQNIDRYCNKKAFISCDRMSDLKAFFARKDKETIIAQVSEHPYFLESHVDVIMNSYESMRKLVTDFM